MRCKIYFWKSYRILILSLIQMLSLWTGVIFGRISFACQGISIKVLLRSHHRFRDYFWITDVHIPGCARKGDPKAVPKVRKKERKRKEKELALE